MMRAIWRRVLTLVYLLPVCLAPLPSAGQENVQRWEVGMEVQAAGACTGILATLPVPMDWPEQQVKTIGEQKTGNVAAIRYRTVSGGVRQMLITIPRLAAGETARVLVTLEIARHRPATPASSDDLRIPSTPSAELRQYLGTSPMIETTNPQIRRVAAEIAAPAGSGDWAQVRAIYDWVQGHVTYEFDEDLKGALTALQTGRGDCEELTSLFIALCRNHGIPARSVWVPGHCYPEFYLEGDHGEGRWYPCQSAGAREFGEISDLRPILQKGDDFRIPGESGAKRYVAESFRAKNATANPRVEFIRRQVGS